VYKNTVATTSAKVAITVALIGLAGVIGAALIQKFGSSSSSDGWIRGRVIDGRTHSPIAYAQITLVGRDETQSADDVGNFGIQVRGLRSDAPEVRLTVSKEGYVTANRAVTPPVNDWIIELTAEHASNAAPIDQPLQVTAQPIHLDFGGRPMIGQGPGCACGPRDIAFPNGPYTVATNEEFIFRYEDSRICRGQGFDNFRGSIAWGGPSTQMANNNRNDEFPGIAGSFRVRFSKPGDYNVVANFSLDCIDSGSANCRNTCSATGTTEVHVR
jgi:hypothetical protein